MKSSKILLILAVLGFFGAGIYLGIQLAKPPPPPDFSGLSDSPGDGTPGDGTPDGGTPGDGTPDDGTPDDGTPGDGTPDDGTPSDGTVDNAGHVGVTDITPPADPGQPFVIQRQPPPPRGSGPRIALVIDDLGRSLEDIDTLAALGVPVTYSVLPFESRTREVVAALRKRGAEILCHLPMEPTSSGANPGPGALLLSMTPQELTAATYKALAAVPGAIGVNNHMGSGISTHREAITPVISVLAEKNLYFLDSRTSPDTVGYTVARQYGVRAAERQVFLDTTIDEVAIREQFARLLEIARQRGSAIAIGHPHKETLEVLATEVRAALELGFEFVAASVLLEG